MEGLAPPLKLIINLRFSIEKGDSIRMAIQNHLKSESDEFTNKIAKWLASKDQGCETAALINAETSPLRKGLLLLLERGLAGEPIYQNLVGLEEDALEHCKMEIDSYLALLPLKLLPPLLLFQFPAFLLLLFGPMVMHFIQQMS